MLRSQIMQFAAWINCQFNLGKTIFKDLFPERDVIVIPASRRLQDDRGGPESLNC